MRLGRFDYRVLALVLDFENVNGGKLIKIDFSGGMRTHTPAGELNVYTHVEFLPIGNDVCEMQKYHVAKNGFAARRHVLCSSK